MTLMMPFILVFTVDHTVRCLNRHGSCIIPDLYTYKGQTYTWPTGRGQLLIDGHDIWCGKETVDIDEWSQRYLQSLAVKRTCNDEDTPQNHRPIYVCPNWE